MTSSASNCISEGRDDYGYTWVYRHSDDEPHDTVVAAIAIAAEVAAGEAARDAKTYVVASTKAPVVAIYVLPLAHPMIVKRALSIMYQVTPDGGCIRSPRPINH